MVIITPQVNPGPWRVNRRKKGGGGDTDRRGQDSVTYHTSGSIRDQSLLDLTHVRTEEVTHWNPLYELERDGGKGVDILPQLLLSTAYSIVKQDS